jgi:hypothetical protein
MRELILNTIKEYANILELVQAEHSDITIYDIVSIQKSSLKSYGVLYDVTVIMDNPFLTPVNTNKILQTFHYPYRNYMNYIMDCVHVKKRSVGRSEAMRQYLTMSTKSVEL